MPDLWIEVDLDAVKHNYGQIVARLTGGAELMAVVKADAYGLGAVEVARALQEEGCGSFAVTTIDEALILRQNGITGRILVLGPSDQRDWRTAVDADIELTVSQTEWISFLDEIASDAGKKAAIHLKLETGMGRTGFTAQQLQPLAELVKQSSHIKVEGAYTHFARGAQRDHSYTRQQHEKYIKYIRTLEDSGITIPVKHVCNSAAFLDFPEYHYDLVRVGTLLGGHFPAPAFEGQLDLKDPWQVKTRIAHLQEVDKGTYVGYQSIYKTKSRTKLAVIPAGYADGFGIEPKFIPQGFIDLGKITVKNIAALFGFQFGREKISLRGNSVRIAGKIGMQLTVLDIGALPCRVGDEVVIPIRRTLANPRIPRLYKKNGEFFRKRIIEEGFLSLNTEYSNMLW